MQNLNRLESGRRRFLKLTAMGAMATPALLNAPNHLSLVVDDAEPSESKDRHRIREMSLLTAAPLPDMAKFYQTVLEMNVELTEKLLVVEAGKTRITFAPAPDRSKPYYHFAFNIPENKILSARNWLGARTKLSVTPANQRDKDYPNEIMPFDFWNAHSIFFWDPAGNILELICRHELDNGTQGDFHGEEILYASEIGLVTEDVNDLAGNLKGNFNLEQYGSGGSRFRAMGDAKGLLILFKRGGTPIGAQEGQSWQIYPTDVNIRQEITYKSESDPHTIRTQW